MGQCGDLGIVGDEDQGGAGLAIAREEEFKDLLAVDGIEVAGGLVGHDDGRFHDEGAGQGDALLFAAGELNRIMIDAVSQSDLIEQLAGGGDTVAFQIQLKGQQDVFKRGERGDELIGLEDKTKLLAADDGESLFFEVVNRGAVEEDFAFAGGVETGKQAEQRTLAAAARSDDGHELAGGDADVNAFENFDAPGAVLDPLAHVANFNHPLLRRLRRLDFPSLMLRGLAPQRSRGCFPREKRGPGGSPGDWYTRGMRSLFRPLLALTILLSMFPDCARAATPKKSIVCFGDSITAGYGLDAKQSYPAALERQLDARGYRYEVKNQGVSGNTSKDAVARVGSVIALHPDVVLVEFGGNDGLRGIAPAITKSNLDEVLTRLQGAHVQVLLEGITLPPNYGADYIKTFDANFRELAAKHHVPLKAMLYDGIYTQPGTIQGDGIHPTAKGSELIAEHLMPLLLPMLHK